MFIYKPETIKIVWGFSAQEHMHTIKNNNMYLNRSSKGSCMRLPAKTDRLIKSSCL